MAWECAFQLGGGPDIFIQYIYNLYNPDVGDE